MTETYGFMFILKLFYNKEKCCNKIETFEGFFSCNARCFGLNLVRKNLIHSVTL